MGLRVVIQVLNDDKVEVARAQFVEFELTTAGELGALIGYAVNGVSPYLVGTAEEVKVGLHETLDGVE